MNASAGAGEHEKGWGGEYSGGCYYIGAGRASPASGSLPFPPSPLPRRSVVQQPISEGGVGGEGHRHMGALARRPASPSAPRLRAASRQELAYPRNPSAPTKPSTPQHHIDLTVAPDACGARHVLRTSKPGFVIPRAFFCFLPSLLPPRPPPSHPRRPSPQASRSKIDSASHAGLRCMLGLRA